MPNMVLAQIAHDEQMIREADHIIDLGPGAGRQGGTLVAEGSVEEIRCNPASAPGRALTGELGELVGSDGARQLMATIEGLDLDEPTWWASAVGVGAMLFTATTVLVTARNALNRLAGEETAEAGPGGIWKMLWERVVSFGMLATVSFILLVSLVVLVLVYRSAQHEVEEVFDADLALERRPLTGLSLARAALIQPGLSLRVIAAIYWQALRLKLKRVPFHEHPRLRGDGAATSSR